MTGSSTDVIVREDMQAMAPELKVLARLVAKWVRRNLGLTRALGSEGRVCTTETGV